MLARKETALSIINSEHGVASEVVTTSTTVKHERGGQDHSAYSDSSTSVLIVFVVLNSSIDTALSIVKY